MHLNSLLHIYSIDVGQQTAVCNDLLRSQAIKVTISPEGAQKTQAQGSLQRC